MNKFPKEQLDMLYEQAKKVDDVGLTTHILQELKEYRDLEEQGLLLKLPCKVRTEVFYICQKNTIALEKGKIYKAVVSGLYAFEKGVCVTIQIYDDYGCTELEEINNFGKTVFLTKEEAEKALERLECVE